MYRDIEVSQVVLMRNCANTWDTGRLLDKAATHENSEAYGSAINLSVSLMMRLGSAILGNSGVV